MIKIVELVIDHTCAFSDFEDKYSMAKEKLSELAEAVEEANREKAEVEEKYSTSKEAIRNLQADLKQAQVGGAFKQRNELHYMLPVPLISTQHDDIMLS